MKNPTKSKLPKLFLKAMSLHYYI